MYKRELFATRPIGTNGFLVCLKPKIPFVISLGIVEEIRQFQNDLAAKYLSSSLQEPSYVLWYLDARNTASCHGLDFNFISKCIIKDKNDKLESYIDGIYNLIFLNYIGLGFPIINCSIISRKLSGIFREFFFLNKICFIRNTKILDFRKILIYDECKRLSFKNSIYQNNYYYYYYHRLLREKTKFLIETIDYEIPSPPHN